MEKEKSYDDIINLPHYVSETRQRMSMHDRAAQFSPFAALTGYDDAVEETARLTDERQELSEEKSAELDERLRLIKEHIAEKPEITVTFFVADEKKAGGAYETLQGKVRTIDEYLAELVFTDGSRVPLKDTFSVEGEFFAAFDMNTIV
ncbi:MAG: hypothetical protein IJF18_04990 [Oscillospiraceae bacterium]|nr:hypothetical protein [Oscillospiraceae bacterium]